MITINGTGFVPTSRVRWKGSNRTTTFYSPTQVTANINASDIASGGTAAVTVNNPTPGGGTSNSQAFTVTNPVPSITSLSPNSATAGEAQFTLEVSGNGFVPTSRVRWNGSNRTTTFISPTQLTAIIQRSDIATPKTASVTVYNATPGGGTSNAVAFAVTQ